jgi:hypothetical protein
MKCYKKDNAVHAFDLLPAMACDTVVNREIYIDHYTSITASSHENVIRFSMH